MITWTIEQLERETETGLVTQVHWRATATDTVGTGEAAQTYAATSYGSLGLTAGDTIIPFADLTKDQVIGWVKDKVGLEAIEAGLAQQIADLKAPKSTAGFPATWNQV